jgi:hypothetical protein
MPYLPTHALGACAAKRRGSSPLLPTKLIKKQGGNDADER